MECLVGNGVRNRGYRSKSHDLGPRRESQVIPFQLRAFDLLHGYLGYRGEEQREREKENGGDVHPWASVPHLWNERRFGQSAEGTSSPCTLAVKPRGTVWGAASVPKCRLLAKAPGLFPLGKS